MEKFLTGFCFFVIYSFIGWICETAFCSIPAKKFINRGFLNGPFCPIYGTGAVLVLWLFSRYQDDIAVLFVMSTVVTSIIAQIASTLADIHAQGLTHGDLKPTNLFMRTAADGSPIVAISDFGHAFLAQAAIASRWKRSFIFPYGIILNDGPTSTGESA